MRFTWLCILSVITLSSCTLQGGVERSDPALSSPGTSVVDNQSRSVFDIGLEKTSEPNVAEQPIAVEAIREFTQNPGLKLTFKGAGFHPENQMLMVDQYEASDPVQTLYMVDPNQNTVVYMQVTQPGWSPSAANPLPASELEKHAREFVRSRIRCFDQVESQLRFEIGNKIDNYFFRWQSTHADPDRPADQPPFVQVSMALDGSVFGYVDSGVCSLPLEPASQSGLSDAPPADYDRWQTYTNTGSAFGFRYPPDWTVEEDYDSKSPTYHHAVTALSPGRAAKLTVIYWLADQSPPNLEPVVDLASSTEGRSIWLLGEPVRRFVHAQGASSLIVLYDGARKIDRVFINFVIRLDFWDPAAQNSELAQESADIANTIVGSFRLIR